jgi:hypothetical protein
MKMQEKMKEIVLFLTRQAKVSGLRQEKSRYMKAKGTFKIEDRCG